MIIHYTGIEIHVKVLYLYNSIQISKLFHHKSSTFEENVKTMKLGYYTKKLTMESLLTKHPSTTKNFKRLVYYSIKQSQGFLKKHLAVWLLLIFYYAGFHDSYVHSIKA